MCTLPIFAHAPGLLGASSELPLSPLGWRQVPLLFCRLPPITALGSLYGPVDLALIPVAVPRLHGLCAGTTPSVPFPAARHMGGNDQIFVEWMNEGKKTGFWSWGRPRPARGLEQQPIFWANHRSSFLSMVVQWLVTRYSEGQPFWYCGMYTLRNSLNCFYLLSNTTMRLLLSLLWSNDSCQRSVLPLFEINFWKMEV